MKKINIWLATALLIVVVGCSKEEPKKTDDQTENNSSSSQSMLKTAGTRNKTKLWPNRIIPVKGGFDVGLDYYPFDFDYYNFEFAPTKFKFVKYTNQKDYIYFSDERKYISPVGKRGGAQPVFVGRANRHEVIRGLCSAIGLYPEHTRRDRIKYITINWDNIDERDMKKYTEIYDDPQLLQTQHLSYESIMMYDSYEHSKNGQPTMIRKSDGNPIPWRSNFKMSKSDIDMINTMYRWAGW